MALKYFSIVGRSGSGKTTLITKLIPYFFEIGLKVGSVKHAHHNVEFDKPGKDSWRHRIAGCSQVLLLTNKKIALFGDLEHETDLRQIVNRWFSDFDLVISEGFKREECLKLEIVRKENNKKPLYLTASYNIQALICDYPVRTEEIPVFSMDKIQKIFQWICGELNLNRQDD